MNSSHSYEQCPDKDDCMHEFTDVVTPLAHDELYALDQWLTERGTRPQDVAGMREVLIRSVLTLLAGRASWNNEQFQREVLFRTKEYTAGYIGTPLATYTVDESGTRLVSHEE